jgi:hypothetical protein
MVQKYLQKVIISVVRLGAASAKVLFSGFIQQKIIKKASNSAIIMA